MKTLSFSLLQLIAHLFREQSKKRLKQHKNNYCPGSINLSQEFIAHIFRTYLQFLPQPFPCCVVGLPSQSQECVDKSVIHYCLTISLFQKKSSCGLRASQSHFSKLIFCIDHKAIFFSVCCVFTYFSSSGRKYFPQKSWMYMVSFTVNQQH